jgi:Tfp pilus assembly protein PilE
MGNRDLKKIRAGLIASAQKGLTRSGMILGIIGTVVIPFIFIVGIVVAVAITMFSDSAISANRDALTSDLVNLASRAQQYYRRPVALGGGGYTFSGLTADATGLSRLTNKTSNGNGTYSITVGGSGRGTAAFLILTGIGNELNNGTAVQVQAKVWPDRDSVWTVN